MNNFYYNVKTSRYNCNCFPFKRMVLKYKQHIDVVYKHFDHINTAYRSSDDHLENFIIINLFYV